MFQIQTSQAIFSVGPRNVTHFLDGFTALTRIHFLDGEATFRSRLLESDSLKASIADDNVAPCITIAEPSPPFEGLDKLRAVIRGADNGYFNVFPFGEDAVVVTDVAKTYRVDQRTLETTGSFTPNVPDGLPGTDYLFPSTTHPVKEFNTSNTLTFAIGVIPTPFFLKWLRKATIVVYRSKSFTDRDIVTQIPIDSDHIPMMHSFAASANYVILFAHPAFMDMDQIIENGFLFPEGMKWQPKYLTTVYVVSLKTSKVLKLKMPSMFFVHHVNSYEERNQVIVDYVIGNSTAEPGFNGLFDLLKLDLFKNRTRRNQLGFGSMFMRIIIDLDTEEIKVHQHTPISGLLNDLEFPVINEQYRHTKLCYVYGVVYNADGKNYATIALVKKDVCHPGKDKVWFKKNHYLFEPRFIPRPGSDAEDDGILICIVMDGEQGNTYLGVFNPVTMELMDKAYTPDRVNFSVHGSFFKDD